MPGKAKPANANEILGYPRDGVHGSTDCGEIGTGPTIGYIQQLDFA